MIHCAPRFDTFVYGCLLEEGAGYLVKESGCATRQETAWIAHRAVPRQRGGKPQGAVAGFIMLVFYLPCNRSSLIKSSQ